MYSSRSSFESILKKTFKDKNVLITGNTGFKGSWLSAWLSKLEANLLGYSNKIPTNPSHFDLIKSFLNIKQVWGDITDTEHLIKTIDEFKPDFIFHLAAQPLVRESYLDPLNTFKTNSIGMLNVLEALRISEMPTVGVLITSDKSYKNIEQIWGYKETDSLGGNDPYSGSKGTAELIFNSYFESFFKNNKSKKIAVARAGNVIGGGDWSVDRIVPDAVRAWSEKKTLVIRSPNATRPWQHVLEPLGGYLLLAVNLHNSFLNSGEAFNFGPQSDQNFTVRELLSSISKSWSFSEWLYESKTNNFSEAGLLKLNCEKAEKLLKWKAVLNFNEITCITSSWYQNYLNNKNNSKVIDFTFEQIQYYMDIYEKRKLK
tara:strand:- start:693 stop:1808 length:1116 start_codon:yes stop_codon:yes gene_type:complete